MLHTGWNEREINVYAIKKPIKQATKKHQMRGLILCSLCLTSALNISLSAVGARPASGMEGLIVRGLHCIALQRLFAQWLLSDPQGGRRADRRTTFLRHTWSQYVSSAPVEPTRHTRRITLSFMAERHEERGEAQTPRASAGQIRRRPFLSRIGQRREIRAR